MKDLKRSIRRHHIERLKNNRKHYWGYGVPHYQTIVDKWYGIGDMTRILVQKKGIREMDARQSSFVVKNPASCSCYGCSNSRKHHGMSLQEIRFHQSADDQERDLD